MIDIVKWPDPRLEQVCEPVAHGERCREIIEEMFASLGPTGIGLAAPQIGIMRRIIVVNVPLRGIGQHGGNRVKLAFINPVLSWVKPGMVEGMEGCLSFPGLEVSVPRYMHVTVQGYDVKWNPVTHSAKNLVARVVQHELDHLDGRCLATYARMAHEIEQAAIAAANAEALKAEKQMPLFGGDAA